MAVNPETGEIITLAQAQKYVQAFRAQYPDQLKGFFVGASNVQKILGQTDCIGIRIYNGYDETTKKTNLVLVGVDKNQKDMTGGVILERLASCPQECDITSSLY